MKVKCDMCDGTGKYWLDTSISCQSCDGTGLLESPAPTQETKDFWIQAQGKSVKVKSPGKWLLFVS